MTAFLHALEGWFVRVGALSLEVGAERAVDLGALVPVEAEPTHRAQDGLDVLVGRPLGIGVVDAQDERAAVMAGERPVVDGGARATDVQVAGGARCESDANGHEEDSSVRLQQPTGARGGVSGSPS